jgi:hypothetical protein
MIANINRQWLWGQQHNKVYDNDTNNYDDNANDTITSIKSTKAQRQRSKANKTTDHIFSIHPRTEGDGEADGVGVGFPAEVL